MHRVVARQKNETRTSVAGGAFAGIIGGIALWLVMLIMTAAQGGDLWSVTKGAGAPFLGERVMQPGFDAVAVVVGIVCHFAVSIVWGVVFGVLAFGLSRGATLIAGLAWGIVVWAGMYLAVLPLVGLGAMARAAPMGMAIVQHVVFGLFVGLGFLPFQRHLPRHARHVRPHVERPV